MCLDYRSQVWACSLWTCSHVLRAGPPTEYSFQEQSDLLQGRKWCTNILRCSHTGYIQPKCLIYCLENRKGNLTQQNLYFADFGPWLLARLGFLRSHTVEAYSLWVTCIPRTNPLKLLVWNDKSFPTETMSSTYLGWEHLAYEPYKAFRIIWSGPAKGTAGRICTSINL